MGVGWNQGFAFDKSRLARVHRFISKDNSSKSITDWQAELSFGPNQVEGYINYLRYFGVYSIEERALTSLGSLIADHDPGWRRTGTLHLLQFGVANNPEATVWHYMINVFLPQHTRFTKREALSGLKDFGPVQAVSWQNAAQDLKYYLRAATESAALGELGLIKTEQWEGEERFVRSMPTEIPPMLLAYALYKQREKHFPDARSIDLNNLLYQSGGVGTAFNLSLDPECFIKMIRPLRSLDIVSYTSTAQLNDVEFLQDEPDLDKFVHSYYEG
jgi:hypothetical protein